AHREISISLPAFGTAQQPTKSQRESAVTEILAAVIAEIPKPGTGRSASAEQSRWRQHHRAKATPSLYPQQRQCRKPRPGSNPCTRFYVSARDEPIGASLGYSRNARTEP